MKMYDLYKWGTVHGVNPKSLIEINGIVYENYIEIDTNNICMFCGESSNYKYITINQETKEERIEFICEECTYC